ncbi:flagellin [Brevundimonas sp. PAMC22021]|uniref:flagellin n=1 Tax=Brevundimonas sp. PAMC22021 TaxID=2861285 RepID=UPI001C62E643|nr:flagellin [Brevundimonas sp. PAMC22021]QYF87524.1 flagellin [Brevundimonas sp. PAMC22021]
MTNSVNTNRSALVALQNLNATNRQLDDTQSRVNTGKVINSAKDNGALWAVAQNQTNQMNALEPVKQSLQRGQSTIDVAMAAGDTVKDLLSQMRNLVLAASDPSADKASLDAYEEDFKNLATQINTTIQGASFNGVNMIANLDANGALVGKSTVATETATGKSLKALASADGKTTINVAGVNFGLYTTQKDAGTTTTAGTVTGAGAAGSASNGAATGIKVASDSFTVRRASAKVHSDDAVTTPANAVADETARAGEWSALMKQVDDSINYVTSTLTKLGTGSKSLDNQLLFTSKLADSLETGIGNLVDADLAKESARLTALQTKQQLGVQALSIANAAPQTILSLFQN